MCSSVAMKTSLVVVIVTFSALILSVLGLKPNIKLSFSSVSKGPSIEYSIQTYETQLSPLHSMMDFDITLKANKFGTFQDLWWSIYMTSKKFTKCDHLNFSIQEQHNETYETPSIFHEETRLEVSRVFVADLKMKPIMALHGCKNTKKNDKMHLNKMILTLYKYGEAMELNIWNTSFTIYNTMFGYVELMNEANEGRTNKVNSEAFMNLTQYCQNLNGISIKKDSRYHWKGSHHPFAPTFQTQYQPLTLIEYGVPILILLTIMVFVLLACCKRNMWNCK